MESSPNPTVPWIAVPTAVLVMHGIGNQEPLQTLDQFARGLIGEFERRGVKDLAVEHCLVPEPADRTGVRSWLRLRRRSGGSVLDVHEYYWADLPQDRASANALQRWLQGTVNGAKSFYQVNRKLGEDYRDKSFFFDRHGKFIAWRYRMFLQIVARLIPLTTGTLQGLINLGRRVPLVGGALADLTAGFEERVLDVLVNVVGDIVLFNSFGARDQFLEVRRQILDGAVASIRRLVEPPAGTAPAADAWPYARVLVAGHSLGSQISFEALNRINQLAVQGQLRGVNGEGGFCDTAGSPLSVAGHPTLADLLCGFVTFGSPLDKIAFFLRELSGEDETYRRQMISNLRCFKQRRWEEPGAGHRLPPPLPRLLDEIRWHNYHDRNDAVSGGLDYYAPVANIHCGFPVKFGRKALGFVLGGWICWFVALLWSAVFWLCQVWQLGFDDVQRFQVAAFFRENWIHCAAFGLWLTGTVVLAAVTATYFAGNFTHLRYWDDPKSPLYRDLLDHFLLPARVRKMELPANQTDHFAA